MTSLRPTVLFACVVALCACADAPGVASVGQPIAGGTDDFRHDNVLGIRVMTGLAGAATCTGELILPNLVLTARHCVSPVMAPIVCETYTDAMGTHPATIAMATYAARNFSVTYDQVIDATARFVLVNRVLIPPNTTGQPLCGRDLAMLELAAPITTIRAIIPRVGIRTFVGEVFTAVGYGATSGTGIGSGRRRVRTGLNVTWVGMLRTRTGVLGVTQNEWVGDTGTCQGDSGGPALDEIGEVFGLLSRGAAGTCDNPLFTRTDSWADWIRSTAIATATAASIPAPEWTQPPNPGTAAFGADCRSDDHCVAPYQCLIIGTRRRCAEVDCAQCPTGWVCGLSQGVPACVPDPSIPDDVPSAEVGTADAGDDGGASTRRGGCSVSGALGHCGLGALAGVALIALVVRRRRNLFTGAVPRVVER